MKPTKQGQICKLIHSYPDENPVESYLIIEDIASYADNQITYVVSLTDLQRNVGNPQWTPRKAVAISELEVLADSLEAFVASWNNPKSHQ